MGSPKKPKGKKRANWIARIFIILAVSLVSLFSYAFFQRYIVRLSTAEIYLPDLPESLDGTRILYASDFCVNQLKSPDAFRSLFRQISSLKPDLILLGGDYISDSKGGEYLSPFFSSLDELYAPLGKFAVLGELDDEARAPEYLSFGGFTLLQDDVVSIEKNGERICIAGISVEGAAARSLLPIAEKVRDGDCVILLSHIPDVLPTVNTQSANGGGMMADLVLCGRSHGRYTSGLYIESGTAMIVSNGVGENGLPLRFFSPPQVHLIILRRPEISFSKDSYQ